MAAEYNRKDTFYLKAKQQGYRSRAAYKLLELDKKFKFLKSGKRILDLGCAPGSWTQVALKKVGSSGRVIGVDLEHVDEVSYGQAEAILLQADITELDTVERVIELADGKLDVLISDLSHKLTGIRLADEARSTELLEMAFHCAEKLLKTNGIFVAKIFPSNDTDVLVKSIRPCFGSFSREALKSTRKSSKEFYLVGREFKGPRS